MTNKVITITGSIFVAFFAFLLIANIFIADASEPIPEQITLHQRLIKTAQQSNKAIASERDRLNNQWNTNVESAKASRQFICATDKKYCTTDFLDPANSGTNVNSFLAIPQR